METEELDLRNFVTYHVMKGLEVGVFDGLATIRTSTVNKVINLDKPLLLSVNGQDGIMMITPRNINSEIVSQTELIYGRNKNKYGLVRVKWRPTHPDTIRSFDTMYSLHRDLIEDLESTIQEMESRENSKLKQILNGNK